MHTTARERKLKGWPQKSLAYLELKYLRNSQTILRPGLLPTSLIVDNNYASHSSVVGPYRSVIMGRHVSFTPPGALKQPPYHKQCACLRDADAQFLHLGVW